MSTQLLSPLHCSTQVPQLSSLHVNMCCAPAWNNLHHSVHKEIWMQMTGSPLREYQRMPCQIFEVWGFFLVFWSFCFWFFFGGGVVFLGFFLVGFFFACLESFFLLLLKFCRVFSFSLFSFASNDSPRTYPSWWEIPNHPTKTISEGTSGLCDPSPPWHLWNLQAYDHRWMSNHIQVCTLIRSLDKLSYTTEGQMQQESYTRLELCSSVKPLCRRGGVCFGNCNSLLDRRTAHFRPISRI